MRVSIRGNGAAYLVNLATGHDVNGQGNVMVLEVALDGIGVVVVDNLVSDEETSVPLAVDVCEVGVLCVEDVVDELEACGKKARGNGW
jgi:hypothetical protein